AHRRRVDDRLRTKRVLATAEPAEDAHARDVVLRVVAGLAGVRRVVWTRAVPDEDVARAVGIVVRAEAEVVVLFLRRRVDPAALVARERPLLVVAGDDVLAQLGTDGLEPVAEVTDDGEVAQDRVTLLRHVV